MLNQKTKQRLIIAFVLFDLIVVAIFFGWKEWSSSSMFTDTAVSGIVTDGTNPVGGAIVKLAATTVTDTSDDQGRFRLEWSSGISGSLVTAWKEGFYNGGVELEKGMSDIEIILNPLPEKDNPQYEWVDPAPSNAIKRIALAAVGKVINCGDCHSSIIYEQWRNNGHARAATSPLFISLYNGTDAGGKPGAHPGFKLDYPHSNGNCSNCHAPAAAVRNVIGVDMNTLEGVEKLGVTCDFCHKVKNVTLKENMSINSGVMHMELLRPPDGHQVFFGPYTDVPDPDAYAPIMSNSLFCAPCHQGDFWGVPIYESFSEWKASEYAKKGISCQNCHMRPDSVTTNFAPGKGGLERDPKTIPSHFQFGSRDSGFLASSVTMVTKGRTEKDSLRVRVAITNATAGHHIPTDSPMRNLILLVTAVNAKGETLADNGAHRIPYWGGIGKPEEGNYEGLPGKGFAKILYEQSPQFLSSAKAELQKQISPAPQWRIVSILSDNRIPALATDVSNYTFKITPGDFPVTVTTTLFYRRIFKNWAAMKGVKAEEFILAKNIDVIQSSLHALSTADNRKQRERK